MDRVSDRFPPLDETTLTPRQRETYQRIVSGPRGSVFGPLRVWLNSPELADRAQELGRYVRYDSALSPAQSELVILVTARIWSSGFEWSHHAPIAEKSGVPRNVIAAIGQAKRPRFEDKTSEAIFDVAVEIHRDRTLSDATYAAAHDALGLPALVDLIGVCGYYTLISMSINAFHVPDGEGPMLPPLDISAEAMFREPA